MATLGPGGLSRTVRLSFLGQEQISGKHVGLEILFIGDRKSWVCDTAYSFWQLE